MRPFSALPPKILITVAIVPCLCLAAFAIATRETALLAGILVAATLAGGGWIAFQAARRRTAPPRIEVLAPFPEQGMGQGLAAFVVAAVLLVACAAPDLYFKDAGELSAAAHGLGVAHPTGFPAWCLAGKAATLLPFGNVFFRLNVLSAVTLAAAAALALLIARAVSRADLARRASWASWVAPAVLLIHPGAWLHGTTTEVYAFSAAGLAATVWAFVRGSETGADRFLVLGWCLVGVGAGGHITWPLYGAGFGLLFTALRLCREGGRARVLWLSLLFAVLGAVIVGYLPVAVSRDPVSNWGNPESLGRLLDHLTAKRIRDSFGLSEFHAGRFLSRLGLAARILWDGTGLLWPLAAWAVAIRRRSAPVAALLLLVIGDLLYAARINPMGIRDLQTGVPAALGVSILAAIGASDLAGRVSGKSAWWPWVPVAVVLLLGSQLALTWPVRRDMGPVDANAEIGRELLARVPANAAILTTSDDLSAGLSALQAIEAARPDVLVLVRQQIADAASVARKVRGHRVNAVDDELLETVARQPFESDGEPIGPALMRLMGILQRRGPVFLELGDGKVDQELLSAMLPRFPVAELVQSRPGPEEVSARARKAAEEAEAFVARSDRWGRDYLAEFLRILGATLGRKGMSSDAELLTRRALALVPDSPASLHNLAILTRDQGRLDEAIGFARAAVEADPGYIPGWRALATIAEIQGRTAEAEVARERLRELDLFVPGP